MLSANGKITKTSMTGIVSEFSGFRWYGALPFFSFLLIIIRISYTIPMYPWEVSVVFLALLLTGIIGLARPEYLLYLVFSIIIITTDDVIVEIPGSSDVFVLEDIKIKGLPFLSSTLLLFLFLLYFFKLYLIQRGKSLISLKYLFVFSMVLFLWLVISWMKGWPFGAIKDDFYCQLFPMLCFYLCINILNDFTKIYRMIAVLFAACFIKSALLDAYYMAGRGYLYNDALIVTYDSAVLMAFGFLISLACALIMYRAVSKRTIFFMLLAILPMAFALVFSLRRAHWVGQILSLTLLFMLATEGRRIKLVQQMAAVGFVLVMFYLLAASTGAVGGMDSVSGRFLTLFDSEQSSNRHHYLETVQTVNDILSNPLFGLGLGSSHSPVDVTLVDGWAEEAQPLRVVHNTFIYMWMKMGLPGLLFLLWLFIKFFNELLRYRAAVSRSPLFPYVAGIGSGVGIVFLMFLSGPVPAYLHQTYLIVLFSALCINLICLDRNERNGLSAIYHCQGQ